MNDALRQKCLFLLDMDGTIYLDEQLFDGTLDFLRHVREIGGRYLFLTNNSSRSVDAYIAKLARLGIEATAEDFLTSVDALILDLRQRGQTDRLSYAFGTASFRKQLAEAGIRVTDPLEDGIEALLCGFDTELSFQKLDDACILLGREVDVIATNPDWVCPTSYGYVPDCGSVCEMLWRATGRRPRVIGKPEPAMALLAMQATGFSPAQTVLIGDRVYTDIACGVHAGIDTILVLSGEGTRADAAKSDTPPTWILDNVRQLYRLLTEE